MLENGCFFFKPPLLLQSVLKFLDMKEEQQDGVYSGPRARINLLSHWENLPVSGVDRSDGEIPQEEEQEEEEEEEELTDSEEDDFAFDGSAFEAILKACQST